MRILSACLIAFLKLYQLSIAPIFMTLGVRCRFEPSCSHYALNSIRFHGPAKGIILAAKRLCRCHPFCEGGQDPVPKI